LSTKASRRSNWTAPRSGRDPKRAWGNGMTDEEMHNLYPVIYAKQMARGFEAHTQRRAMVYSAGGYAGVQQYVATWAGDTGGGAKRGLRC
jgi:alpha-glucosidase (family GH31 glycosyl hydrolase)